VTQCNLSARVARSRRARASRSSSPPSGSIGLRSSQCLMEDANVSMELSFAPELPQELLMRIIAPHAGDVLTLTTLSLLCKSWAETIATSPTLWRTLSFNRKAKLSLADRAFRGSLGCEDRYGGAVLQVTDSQLALLVRRSRSADGQLSFLESLDVTGQKQLTGQGVVTALAGLEGTLLSLHVCGLRCSPEGEDELESLSAFLKPGGAIDITELRQCSARQFVESGEPYVRCFRLCEKSDELCEECDVSMCSYCTHGYSFGGDPPLCEHICAGCGSCCDEYDLTPCPGCEFGEKFCDNCVWACYTCDLRGCESCMQDDMVMCNGGCRGVKLFCNDCCDDGKIVFWRSSSLPWCTVNLLRSQLLWDLEEGCLRQRGNVLLCGEVRQEVEDALQVAGGSAGPRWDACAKARAARSPARAR
jgi:F-box-like